MSSLVPTNSAHLQRHERHRKADASPDEGTYTATQYGSQDGSES